MRERRVAVYTTLCTRDEAAIKAQLDELVEKIKVEEGWSFNEEKDVYFDLGYAKTQIKGRPALEELIQKAKQGDYDLIVVRDTTRIVRNAGLLCELVSDLRECGVDFYFMQENILTSLNNDYWKFTMSCVNTEHDFKIRSARIKDGLERSKLRKDKM